VELDPEFTLIELLEEVITVWLFVKSILTETDEGPITVTRAESLVTVVATLDELITTR
jgi:hypothetical protein